MLNTRKSETFSYLLINYFTLFLQERKRSVIQTEIVVQIKFVKVKDVNAERVISVMASFAKVSCKGSLPFKEQKKGRVQPCLIIYMYFPIQCICKENNFISNNDGE